jgi:thymidylate synthase
MNSLDKQYQSLLQDILDNGVAKNDRTGTGTISVFGRQIRHKMSEGFPLLTTKKMYWKGIVTELLWFLRGDTNIKFLVDNDCHIWDGDAYKNYERTVKQSIDKATQDGILKDDDSEGYSYLDRESFIHRIKTDPVFAEKWGDLGPIYGKQWRSFGQVEEYHDGSVYFAYPPIDQISQIIEALKNNPDSRRIMLTAWNPTELHLSILPPCHYGFQIYTRELKPRQRTEVAQRMGITLSEGSKSSKEWDKECDERNVPKRAISLMWNQRSVDTPLGLPFNIASYGLLLEIISKTVNMVPDELIASLGDAHIYQNQIDGVKEQLSRDPRNLPSLEINDDPFLNYSFASGETKTSIDHLINDLSHSDFKIVGYDPHPTIKIPLSN